MLMAAGKLRVNLNCGFVKLEYSPAGLVTAGLQNSRSMNKRLELAPAAFVPYECALSPARTAGFVASHCTQPWHRVRSKQESLTETTAEGGGGIPQYKFERKHRHTSF